MENLINETRLHLKILSGNFSPDKPFLITIIEFFSIKVWHELISSYCISRKANFLNEFFYKKSKIKPFLRPKNNYFINSKSIDFLHVCIEQYIKERNSVSKWILLENTWKRLFHINLEKFFDSIAKEIDENTDKFSLIFLFLESIRFEKIAKIFEDKFHDNAKSNKSILFFLKFINKNQKIKIKRYFKKILRIKSVGQKINKPKQTFSIHLSKFYCNPFLVENQKIVCFLSQHSNFIKNIYFLNFRKIVHNLSLIGLLGNEIFWIKKEKRIFNKLFIDIISNKIKNEIKNAKKNLKIEIDFYRSRKIKQWHFQFKKKNLSNFEKFAVIVGSGIINLNNDCNSFSNDLTMFNKISVWCKYVSGFSYGLINSNQKTFYEFLPKIMDSDTISEYLKGGLIFGLSSNLKENIELERSFFQRGKMFLSTGRKEWGIPDMVFIADLPVVRYGTFLALANVLSGGIRSPGKSELFHQLKNSVNTEDLSSEGACLGMGILFKGSSSIYLLREILYMVLELSDENKSRLLITSISLIFYKNRNFCNYLFHSLVQEKSPYLRQGSFAIYSLGNFMSSNLGEIKVLLSYLAKETDDNVKFTILLSIGFIFCSRFKLIEEILNQFINHYNPFIRLGFCFALTLSSIGLKCIEKQIKILQKLSKDKVDFISQGACLCLGLLHFFSPSNQGIKKTVKLLKSLINGVYESRMTRFGSIIGLSIIEVKKEKQFSIKKKIFRNPEILFLFLQYWIWIPNICFGFELFI